MIARSRALMLGGLVGFLALISNTTQADEPATMAVKSAKPPQPIAAPISAALDDQAISLSSDGKPFFEFWFRKPLPLAKAPGDGTLAIDTVAEGTLLGVLRIDQPRRDFRDEDLPPGVYTLRLGIQPENGNHQGVAPTRTFALLIPAANDTKLDPIPHNELMKVSATINAAKHPSNLNLQPVDDVSGDFPRLDEKNDAQHKVLLLKLPAQVGDSHDQTTLSFALVYQGTGQL